MQRLGNQLDGREMSDWSEIEVCPECGAGNPHDSELCLRCGVNLKQAQAKNEAERASIAARAEKNRRPKGGRNCKPVEELTIRDLKRYPVWGFDLANEGQDGRDETWVKPVKTLPVTDLSNRIVGTYARLACGNSVYCLLGNISLNDLRLTQQFLGITVYKNNYEKFFLARYFDIDYDCSGPEALTRFLGMRIEDVFPILYDISSIAVGHDVVIKGTIPQEPAERLPEEELSKLVLR